MTNERLIQLVRESDLLLKGIARNREQLIPGMSYILLDENILNQGDYDFWYLDPGRGCTNRASEAARYSSDYAGDMMSAATIAFMVTYPPTVGAPLTTTEVGAAVGGLYLAQNEAGYYYRDDEVGFSSLLRDNARVLGGHVAYGVGNREESREDGERVLFERLPDWCVPLPGAKEWNPIHPAAPSPEKQPIDEEYVRRKTNPTLVRMIERSPVHPTTRAMVLAKMLKPLPVEVMTTEGIFGWMKENWSAAAECSTTSSPPATVAQRAQNGVRVQVDYSEMEYGSCDYSVRNTGSGELLITDDQILDALDTADDMDELISELDSRITESASEGIRLSEGDYDYSDHESSETLDREADYNRGTLGRLLLDRLRLISPETLEDWGEE